MERVGMLGALKQRLSVVSVWKGNPMLITLSHISKSAILLPRSHLRGL